MREVMLCALMKVLQWSKGMEIRGICMSPDSNSLDVNVACRIVLCECTEGAFFVGVLPEKT